MNYRRLLNGYRCQRGRDKSRYQIVIEALAKSLSYGTTSSNLMRLSLKQHGLQGDVGPLDVLNGPCPPAGDVESSEILSGKFFFDPADETVWSNYRDAFAHKIHNVMEDADRICRHEFSLLGSEVSYGGGPIDWHLDPVSGHRWPKKLFTELKGAARSPEGTDIKLPWELSRMQHLPTLGKAYRLTKNERYAREIFEQVIHWLDDNRCPYGVNWTCPMDVAIRIMNILWGYAFIRDTELATKEFRLRLARAIFQHGQYILFNLEFGLQDDGTLVNGNHYLANVVGLLHLGLLCPEIRSAQRWKVLGANALIEEMERQIHPDGTSFESSIAYHRLVTELFTAGALLCRRNGLPLPKSFWERLERMYEFVLYVIRPDGRSPVVGDADDGRLYILSEYSIWDRRDLRYLLSMGAVLFHRRDMKARAGGFAEDAFWWLGHSAIGTYRNLPCDSVGLKSKAFPDAGLYVMRKADKYLLACCGRGVGGAAAHKHNDLLSFELYAGGKAFVVDPGAYVYTRDRQWRNLFRSTRYHNTVVIDGEEQNYFDPKKLFEMKPDADVIVHEWLSTADRERLDVEHSGYARLDPPVIHRRVFQFSKNDPNWLIVDTLSGRGQHTADWFFHFDAGIHVKPTGAGKFRTCCQGINLELLACSETALEFDIQEGWVAPRYGFSQAAETLHIRGTFHSLCRLELSIGVIAENVA